MRYLVHYPGHYPGQREAATAMSAILVLNECEKLIDR
jgi:hypothetical protein